MSTRVRRLVLFAALAGTLGLVIFDFMREERATGASTQSTPGAGSADTKAEGPSRSGAGGDPNLLALPERSHFGEFSAELFGSHNWQPPAIKSGAVLPSAPTAPPMPYKYAGKLVQGGLSSVLLAKGDSVFPIEEGQTLDGVYRVESIGETRITLTYLPLKHKETIPVFSTLPVAVSPGQSGAAAVGGGPGAPAAAVTAPGGPATGAILAAAPQPGNTRTLPRGAPTPESGPARLLWEGPQRVKVGSRFEVALRLTSGQPLHASPMQLRFDPAYLEFVAVKPGKFFGGGDRNFSYRANPDGSIFVGASSPNPAPASDAELLVLTFKPVRATPVAELSVASLNLQGPAGRPIAFGHPGAFRTAITP